MLNPITAYTFFSSAYVTTPNSDMVDHKLSLNR